MTNVQNGTTTRREFIKQSTATAVGAGVLANLSIASGAFAGGDDTIRIGLIGSGGRGTGATVQALSTEGDVQLVAMADAFEDRLAGKFKAISERFADTPQRVDVPDERKFIGFDAYKQVLESDVDLVILATPPAFRSIHFEAAIRAGKHVFMEKPLATDASGVRQILKAVELAKKKRLAVGVGLQRHHQHSYLEAIQRLKDGAIGEIIAMRCYWNTTGVWEPRKAREQCRTEMEYQMRNWYYYTWLSGDHIVEQHIHNLDVCNWLKGAYPVRARGVGGRQVRTDKRYGEIFDHFAIQFEYADGTTAFSQCRHIPNCWNSVSEHFHGSQGHADMSYKNDATIYSPGKKWRYRGPKENPYQTEHDDLFAAIRNGTSYNEGKNGALSTMTAILGRMVAYSGQEITFDAALNSDVSILPKEFAWDAAPITSPNENGEYPIAVPGITKVL